MKSKQGKVSGYALKLVMSPEQRVHMFETINPEKFKASVMAMVSPSFTAAGAEAAIVQYRREWEEWAKTQPTPADESFPA